MLLAACALLASGHTFAPSVWDSRRCGSWIYHTGIDKSGVTLARDKNSKITIVVSADEPSNVQVAAKFLAGDIEKLCHLLPTIAEGKQAGSANIVLHTANTNEWESYDIDTVANGINIVGSNPRGTAFGAYELSERLGVDPLYLWTGRPVSGSNYSLAIKEVHFHQGPPDVKYRGLFHDDEDVFPRPMIPLSAADGLMGPDPNGAVPLDDYKRYFETALRLKMNMVAPWVRTNRYFAVQKLASDWGLMYTSHHYDTLLSDPYHFTRAQQATPWNEASPGLAEKRGVKPAWDFVDNRNGMIKFWKGGVDENHSIDCIWPVGLRGTNDYTYKWPEGYTEDQILAAYQDAFRIQTDLVKAQVNNPVFHFTMYTEMLPYYQTGRLHVPDDVIIVWPDNNDGTMRGLPSPQDPHMHGVYYHLAYLGGDISKQTAQVVPPSRIETEFRKIFEAGATDYMLVNVSDLREYVMGARFIADICWHGSTELQKPDAADRFLDWWSREYFGDETVADAYRAYFASIPKTMDFGYGALKCLGAIPSLRLKFQGKPFAPAMPDTLPTLLARSKIQGELSKTIEFHLTSDAFLFENLGLPAAIDRLTTSAGVQLVEAMSEPDRDKALAQCREAMFYLDLLEQRLQRANRPPFDHWYGPSWTTPRDQKIVLPRIRLRALLKEFDK